MSAAKRFGRVAVLMGGPSAEREISLRSGKAVAKGLREAGYEVTEIDVQGRTLAMPRGIEAVFVALHGEFGEDGGVQALLQARGIPYTGSSPAASRTSFDKKESKAVFAAHGVPTPAYEILREGQTRRLPLPVVVKPTCQGSSLGVSRVTSEAEWAPAASGAFAYGAEILVEAYIEGRELTVGIVDQEAMPVIEIVAPDGNYDFTAKYTKGQTDYRVPAPIDGAVYARCQAIALRTFHTLGCRGLARVDFRLSAAGELFVLELNNIPGFTETSLLPKAAAAHGLPFPQLCDRIMNTAAC